MRHDLCLDCPLRQTAFAAQACDVINSLELSRQHPDDAEWLDTSDIGPAVETALALDGVNRCAQLREVLPRPPRVRKHATAAAACPEMGLYLARGGEEPAE